MAKNKTLYVNDEDEAVWVKAKRVLQRTTGESLSSYITNCLKILVKGKK
jgi:hypothetical protein